MRRLVNVLTALLTTACCTSTPDRPNRSDFFATFSGATSESTTQYVIAVLSEGYTANMEVDFNADVKKTFDDVLMVDFYQTNRNRFRVIPVFKPSVDAGVSIKNKTVHDTAFKLVFHGVEADCYFDIAPEAYGRIDKALENTPHDFVVVFSKVVDPYYKINAGCVPEGSKTAFVTDASHWTILAHELGHAIGRLLDERGGFSGVPPSITSGNCSTEQDSSKIAWHSDIPTHPVHPPSAPDRTDPTKIGMYEGCALYSAGAYRPTDSACRMGNSFLQPFCKVCHRLLEEALSEQKPLPPGEEFVLMSFFVGTGANPPPILRRFQRISSEKKIDLPVGNGVWTLSIDGTTVAHSSIDTEVDVKPKWRAYGGMGDPETLVDGPYRVVDFVVPVDKVANAPAGRPQIELFRLSPHAVWTPFGLPALPADPLLTLRSKSLEDAVSKIR